MIEHVGNLAALTGHVIIVHGVNGGWQHGPKFGAGFAAALNKRGPEARDSYFRSRMGIAAYREKRYARAARSRGFDFPYPTDDGVPLGYHIKGVLEGGEVIVHGVTQRSVRGTLEKRGSNMVRNDRPAHQWAVGWVVESAVTIMRNMAAVEGTPRAIHLPRIGCGLGGLEWDDVRGCLLRIESMYNTPLESASDALHAAARDYPVVLNVWSLPA